MFNWLNAQNPANLDFVKDMWQIRQVCDVRSRQWLDLHRLLAIEGMKLALEGVHTISTIDCLAKRFNEVWEDETCGQIFVTTPKEQLQTAERICA